MEGVPVGVRVPGSAAEAEQMALQALSFLVGDSPAELGAVGQGDRLKILEQLGRRLGAAQAATLSVFASGSGHEGDGCQSPTRWQAVVLGLTKAEAGRRWKLAKTLAGLPEGWIGLAAGRVAESILVKIGRFVAGLPEYARDSAARILIGAAVADGVTEQDVIAVMSAIKEQLPEPDPESDGDGGGRNEVEVATTIDGVGVLRGRIDAELAALAQQVFAALGQKKGEGDDRTIGERNHDALKEALRRVTDGGMLGDVRGRRPNLELTMPLGTLRREPGARQAEITWTRQAATSLALALSCDAKVSGTVTGHPQPRQRLVELTRRMLDEITGLFTGGGRVRPGLRSPVDDAATAGLPAFDWASVPDGLLAEVIDQMLAWATEALSGPDGLAACLRKTLGETLRKGGNRLDAETPDGQDGLTTELAGALLAACHGIALPLDVSDGTETVPLRIRQLVERRDQQCRWPGCDVPAHRAHIHHIHHRSRGGDHHPGNLVVLCTRHHERFIHGLGWTIRLHGDGTVTVTSPDGDTTTDDHPPTARSP